MNARSLRVAVATLLAMAVGGAGCTAGQPADTVPNWDDCSAVAMPIGGDYRGGTWFGAGGTVYGFSREEDTAVYRTADCIGGPR
jgi:hypothetical protein